jgi:hypothetical protein
MSEPEYPDRTFDHLGPLDPTEKMGPLETDEVRAAEHWGAMQASGPTELPSHIDAQGQKVIDMPELTITGDPTEGVPIGQAYDEMTHRGYTIDAHGAKVEDDERPIEGENLAVDAPTSIGLAALGGEAAAPHLIFDLVQAGVESLAEHPEHIDAHPGSDDPPDAGVPDATMP